MLFSLCPVPAVSSGDCATSAAIRCLLAYTYGLEDCDIGVAVADGGVTLTGHASCEAAVAEAIGIAADFTSKPVLCNIRVICTPQST